MADADKQIRQMVEFVRLEAKEKASEIRAKAKADADVEKQLTVLNAKTKLGDEYDRKEKALATEQKIAASMAEAKQRSRLLAARDEYVQKLHAEAKARLSHVAASNAGAYNALLKGLIKQGLVDLEGEPAAVVSCRPADAAVAKAAAAAAAAEVAADAKAKGGARAVAVTVVPEPALAGSAGGVWVTGAGGRIKVDNTLEARMDLAFADLTPVIRDLLFPSARAEAKVKPPPNFPHAEAHHAAPPAAHPPAAHAHAGAGAAHAAASPAARAPAAAHAAAHAASPAAPAAPPAVASPAPAAAPHPKLDDAAGSFAAAAAAKPVDPSDPFAY